MFRARTGPLAEERLSTAPGRASGEAFRLVDGSVSPWASTSSSGAALPLIGYEPVQACELFRARPRTRLSTCGSRPPAQAGQLPQRLFFLGQEACRPVPVSASLPAGSFARLPRPQSQRHRHAASAQPRTRRGDPMLCMAGDTHHLRTVHMGPSVHLVAGGGGAFLHGAEDDPPTQEVPLVEFPGPRASRATSGPGSLARCDRWRREFIPHLLLAILFGPRSTWAFARGR